MGRCDTAPVLEIGHKHIDNATPEKVDAALKDGHFHADIPAYEDFAAYKAAGGYAKLAELRKSGDWETVQETVLASGLRGLGGAGFPSGRKWGFVRANPGIRYLAVNGDEGEPGTFKDRYYLERTPHLMLEGMLIAAWAVEAERSFIYMRDEYPAVLEILRREIAALEDAGIILKGEVELRRGAGAYICGEESAMIESIEGKRGIPRQRPPYVAAVGIFDRPTLVHNVETLHWVARIVREGPEVLNSTEKNGRKGLRSYSVSGRVAKPGVYLLPAGSTITDIIEACGGMAEGHAFKAYQPGGPSSGLLPASMHDVPLGFRHAPAAWHLHRLRRRRGPVGQGQRQAGRAEHAALLRKRKLRPVHALPGRLRKGGEADAGRQMGRRPSGRPLPGHGRCLDLRAWAGCPEPDPPDDETFPG